MTFFTFALSVAVIIAVIVGFLTVYMRKVADVALTDQFRAAETIVAGHIPDRWIAQINRRIGNKWATRLTHHEVNGIELALDKIDKLYSFYENSPFFENAEARDLLLSQLQETRERWVKMTWDELVSGQD
jgi:hypothetical protein